ncbi:MAG: hypothetical protein QXX12_04355 [Nanopusillaceae archaeon]
MKEFPRLRLRAENPCGGTFNRAFNVEYVPEEKRQKRLLRS